MISANAKAPDLSEHCTECGFPLDGLTDSASCPECGTIWGEASDENEETEAAADTASIIAPESGEVVVPAAEADPVEDAAKAAIQEAEHISAPEAEATAAPLEEQPAAAAAAAEPEPEPEPEPEHGGAEPPDDAMAEAAEEAVPGPARDAAPDAASASPVSPAQEPAQTTGAPEHSAPAAAAAVEQQGPAAAAPPEASAPQTVRVTGHDYIVQSILRHIDEIKVDLVNNPVRSFLQILAELDKSNKELHQAVLEQGQGSAAGVQEAALAIVTEIARLSTQQNLDAMAKTQEVALTIVSEINAATTSIQEAQANALAELSETVQQLVQKAAVPPPAQAAAAPAAEGAEAAAESSSDTGDYILYLCIAMAVFTILNFFITIYVVKLIQ